MISDRGSVLSVVSLKRALGVVKQWFLDISALVGYLSLKFPPSHLLLFCSTGNLSMNSLLPRRCTSFNRKNMEEVAVGVFFTNSSWPLRGGEKRREHLWAQEKNLREVRESGEELVLLEEE